MTWKLRNGLVTEVFTNRSDWLVHVGTLEPMGVLTIHPLDGLTTDNVVAAMRAQGLLYRNSGSPGYRIVQHGTKIIIQREKEIA